MRWLQKIIIPRLVTDENLSPDALDQIVDRLVNEGPCSVDRDSAKAWVFALAHGEPVGCIAYYPPDATSLWVRKDYRGSVHATDMIRKLSDDVFRRFGVGSIRAYVLERHTSTRAAFRDAGWSEIGIMKVSSGTSMIICGKGQFDLSHAIVLSGGKGERLHPFTLEIPKGLIPIQGTPLLGHVVKTLVASNVHNIAFALGHMAKPICEHFGRLPVTSAKFTFNVEDTPLDTGGAIAGIYKKRFKEIPSGIAVLNGDNLLDIDFQDVYRCHEKSKAMATICVKEVEDSSEYGSVVIDDAGRIQSFLEKGKTGRGKINCGYYIIDRKALGLFPKEGPFSLEKSLFPDLSQKGLLTAYDVGHALWFDVGTPQRWERAINEWKPKRQGVEEGNGCSGPSSKS